MLRVYEPDAPVTPCRDHDAGFTWKGEPALEYQLEHALLFGVGSAGNVVLRELIVWQREWSEWRDTIMPKFNEAFPGRRPAAAYITGEIPQRPLAGRGQSEFLRRSENDQTARVDWPAAFPSPIARPNRCSSADMSRSK
jgi:hypothetical protein